MRRLLSPRLVVPLLSVAFVPVWASGFIVGKFAARNADVMTILFWRFVIAVAVTGTVALVVRPALPRGIAWLHLVVAALLLQLGQFTGVYAGMAAGVPAGLSSLVLGMAPLLVGIVAPLILPEKLGAAPLIGLLLGAAGVYVVFSEGIDGVAVGRPVVFPLLGMLSLAAGTLYQKRFNAGTPILTSVVVQLGACLAVTAAVMPFSGAAWLPRNAVAWASISSLALVGSSLSFAMMFVLLRRVTTVHVSGLLNLVPPTVALAAVPILGENLTLQAVLGLLLALVGMFVGTGVLHRGAAAPAAPTAAQPSPRPPTALAVADDTASDLTEASLVRRRAETPQTGWRGAVYRLSRGVVNPGVGDAELAARGRMRRIRRPLSGPHRIAVTSIKGGVGKTSVAACLGLVLAEYRGDRVIALDANPDAGTLADRLAGGATATVRDLVRDLDRVGSVAQLSRYTDMAGRLHLLASEQDPAMSEAFCRDEYERVCGLLARYYDILLTDSGTGLVHSAMEGTLALADSLVVVGAPTVDGASRAAKTLDWLVAHGHGDRVADAVVVLSCDRISADVDVARVRAHFAARCRSVIDIPFDPHLAAGGCIELARLRPATLDAFRELAAVVADGFALAPVAAAPVAAVPIAV